MLPLLPLHAPSPTDQIQGRLLNLAALFLGIYALALTLSPAARLRTWQVEYRWEHWLAFLVWLAVFNLAHRQSAGRLPGRDPYLLPVAALLSGWGLLTVWRLFPAFGLRQSLWLLVAVAVFIFGLQLPANLSFLRRYKYLWLTTGLILTGLTLLMGTNPSGGSLPRLWLGCCGVYLQPSEPLKLLLIVYLAAYMSDRLSFLAPVATGLHATGSLLPLLAPTLVMTSLALLLLLAQRDLGTASIFLFLYATIVYVTSDRKRILLFGGLALVLAGTAGYLLFDVVRVRVDAWINPWSDPSGRSYQIVQSLIAVANGGLFGRGPGLGSPGLVPIPHSDFIFTAIAEENGLVGVLGLILLIALLAGRGLSAALHATDFFRRYLAAGLTAYLAGQAILIIGGNLRLLPLTGVTLPFVSYGGSSLVTAFFTLLLLIQISNRNGTKPAVLIRPQPYLHLHLFLLAGLGATALLAGWWSIFRSPALVGRTDNPRRAIADRFVRRGSILDRDSNPLNFSTGESGNFTRQTLYPDLSNVLGYTHPVYGQAGLEAGADDYLRGLQGNPGLTMWWNHLLYGQPPPGLDIRTSLDLDLQQVADQVLENQQGALVLLNAESGEILAMASQPAFDSNRLDEDWPKLIQDERAPLLNRATQGLYAPGPALGPLLLAQVLSDGERPPVPQILSLSIEGHSWHCSLPPIEQSWGAVIAGGCPGPVSALGSALGEARLLAAYQAFGLFNAPALQLPAEGLSTPAGMSEPAAAALGQGMQVTPLQMALAGASLSAAGTRPAPSILTAVNTTQAGWVILSPLDDPVPVLPPAAAKAAAIALAADGMEIWQSVASTPSGGNASSQQAITWYLGGTLPDWNGTPLALALVMEGDDPLEATQAGQSVLKAAMQP